VSKVAQKLSVPKDTVKAAQRAGTSATAMAALGDGQLSLAEAAAITEFEDMPGAVDRLLNVAGTRRFEHLLAQLREEKANAAAEAQAAQGYSERGFTVLRQRPESWNEACIPLQHLVTADGADADEQAVADPTQWAVLLYEDTTLIDARTGEPVDEDSVDWDTENQPDATPEEGLRHADTVAEARVFVPEYFCLDYRAAGLSPASWFARNAGMLISDEASSADLDEQAREAARAQADEQRAEAERRGRRKVLALNKLGDAAMLVRREFVKKLLSRKTPPKGAGIFVADCLARDAYLLTNHNASEVTAALLGVDNAQAVAGLAAGLPAGGDGRAQVLTLALVLGALESRTPKDAWRSPTASWGQHVGSAHYLRWLSDNDYPLAAVEEVITGATTADEVYDQYVIDAAKE
jgi:ParB family chromosome partitioning protein